MTDDHSRTDAEQESRTTAEVLTAEVVDEFSASTPPAAPLPPPPPIKRRVWLPLILLLLTCLSTFLVGASHWPVFMQGMSRSMVLANWRDGLIYMACVLGILLTHEMGHFLATVRYGIPASLPFVIPMPFLPFGTFGAVIGMDGRRADRKEIFDIGLAGPLAGLAMAIPIMIWGIVQLDLSGPELGQLKVHNPLLVQWIIQWVRPEDYKPDMTIAVSQLNPYFFAGWVGMFVTGLNMLPVSQLDGGHVIHALFGRRARWIARGFVGLAMLYLTYSVVIRQDLSWILMLGLIFLIGIDHPPTRNDNVKLGWFRYLLGLASLAIPILCFAPQALSQTN